MQGITGKLTIYFEILQTCSIENDCRPFGNRTFDYVRLTKFYCEFDYVRLPNPIERLVFDWFDYRTFEEIRREINYTDGGSANYQ